MLCTWRCWATRHSLQLTNLMQIHSASYTYRSKRNSPPWSVWFSTSNRWNRRSVVNISTGVLRPQSICLRVVYCSEPFCACRDRKLLLFGRTDKWREDYKGSKLGHPSLLLNHHLAPVQSKQSCAKRCQFYLSLFLPATSSWEIASFCVCFFKGQTTEERETEREQRGSSILHRRRIQGSVSQSISSSCLV